MTLGELMESLNSNEVLLSMARKLLAVDKLMVRHRGFNYKVGSIDVEEAEGTKWVDVRNDNNISMIDIVDFNNFAEQFRIKKVGDDFVLYDKLDGPP